MDRTTGKVFSESKRNLHRYLQYDIEKTNKTFLEYFLDEIVRKQERDEIDADKAQQWVAELQGHLLKYAQDQPTDPIVPGRATLNKDKSAPRQIL